MIAALTGRVLSCRAGSVVLDVGGVGYEVHLTRAALALVPATDGEIFVHIHTSVREDAIVLYGFFEQAEKELFLQLISVSGIGPKLALAILSGMKSNDLIQAIVLQDVRLLTSLPGVGKKTAERLCMELKDKVSGIAVSGTILPSDILAAPGSVAADVLSALENLGYSRARAQEAFTRIKKEMSPEAFETARVEEILRLTLRTMA